MRSFLRHILFFILQFVGAFVVVAGSCIVWTLYHHGWDYRLTVQYGQDLHLFVKVGLVVAALFSLVLLCYHMTRKSLDGPDDWNSTDNFG